jgi:hypothetical protein
MAVRFILVAQQAECVFLVLVLKMLKPIVIQDIAP